MLVNLDRAGLKSSSSVVRARPTAAGMGLEAGNVAEDSPEL